MSDDQELTHPPHAWAASGSFLCWETLTTKWTCSCPWAVYTYENAPPDHGWRGAYQSPVKS